MFKNEQEDNKRNEDNKMEASEEEKRGKLHGKAIILIQIYRHSFFFFL